MRKAMKTAIATSASASALGPRPSRTTVMWRGPSPEAAGAIGS